MSALPKGWAKLPLDEAAKLIRGVSYKKNEASSTSMENYLPILRANNIQNGKLVYQDYVYVPDNKIKEEQYIKINDIVIAMSSGSKNLVGKSGISQSDFKGSFGTFCGLLRPNNELHSRFVGLFTRSQYYAEKVSTLSKGVNINNLKPSHFSEIHIPIAPLNEQIRIADKLDSILAKVDIAQSRLDKIPVILKRFRQSVLAAATSGELTKEWREFNKIDKGSWQQVSIDELSSRAFDGPFGSKLKTADYTEFGVKVVRLENIGHLTFKGDKETFISEKKYQDLIKNTLEHNDILFSSFVDEEIRTCLFEARDNTYINKADCFCIRVSEEKISPKFLMYNLGCKHTFDKIKKQVHGVTRPRINLRFLKSFEVSVPTVEEQIRIVEIIDALFHKAAKVEAQFLDTKSKLDRLTQSILAKAFRGELVSQSDKDESAEALLKRIKAESPKVKSNK